VAAARRRGSAEDQTRTSTPYLRGWSVLVVEDDFSTAVDMPAALRVAGARAGPCADERSARALLASEASTATVLDLNLGAGGHCYEWRALYVRAPSPWCL